jgi:hypothetical protein
MKCIRFFDYVDSDEERKRLIEEHPEARGGWWWCSKCQSFGSRYFAMTVPKEILEECIRKNREEDILKEEELK